MYFMKEKIKSSIFLYPVTDEEILNLFNLVEIVKVKKLDEDEHNGRVVSEDVIDLKSVTKLELADFDLYNAFIIGTPTLGEGELAENWIEFLLN